MRQETEWQLIDSSKPYFEKNTEHALLRIYIEGDGFKAEVHADGSHEHIRLNPNGVIIKKYVYGDIDDQISEDSSMPSVCVSEKEIRSIEEMESFIDEYVSNWDLIKIKERAEDYNKQRLMKRS